MMCQKDSEENLIQSFITTSCVCNVAQSLLFDLE